MYRQRLNRVPGIAIAASLLHFTALAAADLESPGTAFADPQLPAGAAVTMVVVPAGEFRMGSPETEGGRSAREGPQRDIVIPRPFAMALTEVTVAQFRAFVEATGYVTDAERAGLSQVFSLRKGSIVERDGITWRNNYRGTDARDKDPVVHVSWQDAHSYATWLSETTGQRYRLPTEAEFEYALRAGSTSRYWWGDGSPTKVVENLTGSRDRQGRSELHWPVSFRNYSDRHWGPAPAGSFVPNPYGLKDMGGNLAEWVADCFRDSLADVPADGSAVEDEKCAEHVLRGASWANPPPMARSAFRIAQAIDRTNAMVGFRVARDVDTLVFGQTQEPVEQ